MSHAVNFVEAATVPLLAQVVINNYALGGETITAAELDVVPAVIFFATVPANQNSLGVPLFPVLVSGKVMLFQFTGGTFAQIPATNNLNAIVNAILFG